MLNLVIAEKPSQARTMSIAFSLVEQIRQVNIGTSKKPEIAEYPIYEGLINGDQLIVMGVKGHLFSLTGRSPSTKTDLLKAILYCDFKWSAPSKKSSDFAIYKLLCELVPTANRVIIATDNDDEGELIGMNILRAFNVEKIAARMVFHAMTPLALENSYNNLIGMRYEIAEAAEARTWLDKSFGKIFSKTLTIAYQKAIGQEAYIKLNVGRVITPTLASVIENTRLIETMKAQMINIEPERVIKVDFFMLIPNERILESLRDVYISQSISMEEAINLRDKYRGAAGKVIDTGTGLKKEPPDFGGLKIDDVRTWAYKNGIDYSRCDSILESLYLAGLITYPRSESDLLPDPDSTNIVHKGINADYHRVKIDALLDAFSFPTSIITRQKPVCGLDYDGAHWAIHPVGDEAFLLKGVSAADGRKNFKNFVEKMPPDFKLVYDFIARRYLASFGSDEITRIYAAKVQIDLLKDFGKDSEIEIEYYKQLLDPGYTVVMEPAMLNAHFDVDQPVPLLQNGDLLPITVTIKENWKIPELPERINKSKLFEFMQQNSLGTDATRASLLEKLWSDNFVRGDPPIPTILGLRIHDGISAINHRLCEPELTAEMERMKDSIKAGESSIGAIKNKVIQETSEIIASKIDDLAAIGEVIAYFGLCQTCKSRMRLISYQKATGESGIFLACSNKECKFTAPI